MDYKFIINLEERHHYEKDDEHARDEDGQRDLNG